MHIVLAILAALGGAYFLFVRLRAAAEISNDLVDMARDVRSAARRLGFRRKTNVHPAEMIEDPNIAIASIATAMIALDDLPTREQRDALERQMQSILSVPLGDAQELTILGQWMVQQCGGPAPAIARLSRKLYKMVGSDGMTPLLSIIQNTLGDGAALNPRQQDALDEIRRAFRL